MLTDAHILDLNPWWTEPAWEGTDPHLRRLREQPRQLPAPLVDTLDLSVAAVHTVRGPRQVGKSTALKLLVQRALSAGRQPTSIIYLALDHLEGQPIQALADTVERAKVLARNPTDAVILLDEVTVVPSWQTAVKSLWDLGTIDRDVVVCTGSSAIDMTRGTAHGLPGRRGAGRDHLVLPQPFAAFARALYPNLPPSPGESLADLFSLFSPRGRQRLEEMQLHQPRLDRALELYVRFGGLPAAVAEAASGATTPSETTRRILWDSLIRETYREGAGEPALHALLERVLRSLGSKTNWSRMAEEMGVPLRSRRTVSRQVSEYRTVRDYIEFLASGYFLLIVYFWRPDSDSNAISKDKKIYFGDPLMSSVVQQRTPGLRADPAALVENAVALALYRRYEPPEHQFQGFVAPRRLHVWGTAAGGEIDFVCGPRNALEVLEVKFRRRIDGRSLNAMTRSLPGRPIVVATKGELAFRDDLVLVPASLLLWALA
jgi:hypothetical protein